MDLHQVLQPTRTQSQEIDAIAKVNEQTGMDIVFQAELWLERKDTLYQNLTKAYALIFSTYTATRQCRIGLKNIETM
jgi:hypothetical protein